MGVFDMSRPLGESGLALEQSVLKYAANEGAELEEYELAILRQACEIADRLEQISEAIASLPFTSPEVRKLLVEERLQRNLFALFLTTRLGLPTGIGDITGEVGKTPQSRQHQDAATKRWRDKKREKDQL